MYGKCVFRRVVSLSSIRFYQKDSTKKLLEFLADMPKSNSPKLSESQHRRQNIAKRNHHQKYGSSTVYLQVVGSGARGVPNTVYLFTDQKRYLFNCGECTQRLAHEHKVKLSRLEHIFITNKTWMNIGGLPGLSLTLQDVGVPNITLHGPEGLDELYNATKRFVIMKDMQITMAKCTHNNDFEDDVMTVKYVLLGPLDDILVKDLPDLNEAKPPVKKAKFETLEKEYGDEFKHFIHDDTDYYKPETRNFETSTRPPDLKRPLRPKAKSPVMKKTEKVLHDLQKKSHCSVAYICTLKSRLGTLDLAKCVEFGVKPGPMLGQLKKGQDVILPDGTLVLSRDVKTPDEPGAVFIVLEVPDISYLKESEFSAHFDDGNNPKEKVPTLIVHYTPPHVYHEPAYRAFMTRFGPSTRHLILNSQNSCLGSEAVHRTQHKLHLLDSDIFPMLKDVSMPTVWNAAPPLLKTNSPIRIKGLEELKNKIALAQFQNIINMEGTCKGDCRTSCSGEEAEEEKLDTIAARTLTVFHLKPKRQPDRSAEPKLHIQDYIQETMDVDGFVPSLEQFRRLADSIRYAQRGSQQEYPKVVFLGTGSCIPSKTRNTSAIVIHVNEERSMLLDCGEGTFGQMVRFFGPKRINAFLRTLKAIYVSHLHADHHIGLIGVLQARREAHHELNPGADPPPLYLLAPGQIVSWLTIYDQQFEPITDDFVLIPNQGLIHDGTNPTAEISPAILADIGIQEIKTCLVSHCPNAFGVSITFDRHKITYSGDTIPCEALIKLGAESTLLIHEATMEDELAEEARVKMHSTTTQAIEVGRKMSARYTVLTHFSQRYARLPRLNANILSDNNSVGIAFDNMQITMNDLELLPHMYAPLQLMFAEHCVEMELRAANRARQKQRRNSNMNLTEAAVDTRCPSSCRGAIGAQIRSQLHYRESNSSYLRQKRRLAMSTDSKADTSSRQSRRKSMLVVSRPKSLSDSSPDTKLDILAAPRSMSESSNLSKTGDSSTRSQNGTRSSAPSSTCHSRTLSAGSGIDSIDEEDFFQNHETTSHGKLQSGKKKRRGNPNSKANSDSFNEAGVPIGYGRPLLTSLNKPLVIKREPPNSQTSIPLSINRNKGSPDLIRNSISPMRDKSENRRVPWPFLVNKSVLVSGKSFVKFPRSMSKEESNINYCVGTTKIPIPRTSIGANDTTKMKIKSVVAATNFVNSDIKNWNTEYSPRLSSAKSYSSPRKENTPIKQSHSKDNIKGKQSKGSILSRASEQGAGSHFNKRTPNIKQNDTNKDSNLNRCNTTNRVNSSNKDSNITKGSNLNIDIAFGRAVHSNNVNNLKKDCNLITNPSKGNNLNKNTNATKGNSLNSLSKDTFIKTHKSNDTNPSRGKLKDTNCSKENDYSKRNGPISENEIRRTVARRNIEMELRTSEIMNQHSNGNMTNKKRLDLTKKSLPSLREALHEQLKKEHTKINKDIKPISLMGVRPNTASHSSRSFKPQLEDIKSSFILLNKKSPSYTKNNVNMTLQGPQYKSSGKQEKLVKVQKSKKSSEEIYQQVSNTEEKGILISKPKEKAMSSSIPKRKPIDDKERREMLEKVKQKYQSRGFFNDARYDKIEGLNWISWK